MGPARPTSFPHRAVVVSVLSLAFLSRQLEIGLMKHATLSEICVNTGCGFHLQPVPAEADHTFLSSVPPPRSACLLLVHSPSSTTNLHLLSLWNSAPPPIHVCSAPTHALSPYTSSGAPFMRQSENKWWSAVQRVGSFSSLNMDDWSQPEGKCVSQTVVLPTRAPGWC